MSTITQWYWCKDWKSRPTTSFQKYKKDSWSRTHKLIKDYKKLGFFTTDLSVITQDICSIVLMCGQEWTSVNHFNSTTPQPEPFTKCSLRNFERSTELTKFQSEKKKKRKEKIILPMQILSSTCSRITLMPVLKMHILCSFKCHIHIHILRSFKCQIHIFQVMCNA